MAEANSFCTKKKNCSRPKCHPGMCKLNRPPTVKLWEFSPVLKKHKLAEETIIAETLLEDVKASTITAETELQNVKNATITAETEFITAETELQIVKNATITAETELCELRASKVNLEIEIEDRDIQMKKIEKKFQSLKLLVEQKEYSKLIREKNPTTWDIIHNSSSTTRYERHRDSKLLLEYIHGGSEGAIYGAWDFLCKNANFDKLEKLILDFKKGKWLEKLYGKFSDIFNKSEEAMNQAVAAKYKLHMSRRQFTFLCKIQSATFDIESDSWKKKEIAYGEKNIMLREKCISHESVQKFVKSLDIGEIHSLGDIHCGAFRTVTAICTMMIDLHLKTKSLRNKLRWFNGMENHFIIQFSDDGAPETRDKTMTIGSVSSWNFGERIRSRDFHYLLHTVDASEKDDIISLLWKQHTDEMLLLEGNILNINNEKVTVEFQPSADQAWQAFANNELPQSATWFSTFAKVHKSETAFIGGTVGNEPGCTWPVPTAESREHDLAQLNKERERLKKQNLSKENFHKKELVFMAENGLRQLGPPRIGIFADRQKPDPMHLEVNNWEQLLDVIYLHSVRENKFELFINAISAPIESGGCGLQYITKGIKEHYVSQKKFNKLPGRIIGDQAITLAWYMTRVIDAMANVNDSPLQHLKLLVLSKICEYLRVIGSIMNQTNTDVTLINELKEACTMYLNIFALFFKESCNSTVWTIAYIIPYHATELFKRYAVGYGILSMQGKEAKHSGLKQELKSGTNRSCDTSVGKWHQIARSSFVRSFYLPYHFPIETYRSHYKSRYPPLKTNVCRCFRALSLNGDLCIKCIESMHIVDDANNGYLSEANDILIRPIKCQQCDARFSDKQTLNKHFNTTHNATELPQESTTTNNSGMKILQLDPKTMKPEDLRKEILRLNPQASTKGTKKALVERLESIWQTL